MDSTISQKDDSISFGCFSYYDLLLIGVIVLLMYFIHKTFFCDKPVLKDNYETDPYITPVNSIESLNLTSRIWRDGKVHFDLLNNFDQIKDGDRIAVISSDGGNKIIRKTIEDSLSNRHYIADYVDKNLQQKGLMLSRNYVDHMIYLEPALVNDSSYPLGYWYFVRPLQ